MDNRLLFLSGIWIAVIIAEYFNFSPIGSITTVLVTEALTLTIIKKGY